LHLQSDPANLAAHRERRAKKVEAKRSSAAWKAGRRTDGVVKTALKRKRAKKVKLIAPEDQFYKLEDYERLFGPVALSKKRGHRITKMMGLKGVLVPGEQCAPYRVQRVIEDGIERDDDLDVGSDPDEEVIEQKRESLEQAMDDAYESSCVGLVHAALLAASSSTAPPAPTTKTATKRTPKVDDVP